MSKELKLYNSDETWAVCNEGELESVLVSLHGEDEVNHQLLSEYTEVEQSIRIRMGIERDDMTDEEVDADEDNGILWKDVSVKEFCEHHGHGATGGR